VRFIFIVINSFNTIIDRFFKFLETFRSNSILIGDTIKLNIDRGFWDIFGNLSSWAAFFATIILLIITYLQRKDNKKLINLNQKMIENEIKPNILVYLDYDKQRQGPFAIVIENKGKGVAYDLKVTLLKDVPIFNDKNNLLNDLKFFKNGVKNFMPNEKREFLFMNIFQTNFIKFEVDIEYKDIKGEIYESEFLIDVNEYKGIIIHSKDPLVEISDGLKEISKKL
jgi:hypothetical protein